MKEGKSSKLLPTKLLLVTPCEPDQTPQIIADHPGPLYVMSLLRASGLKIPSAIKPSIAGVSAASKQSGRKPSMPIISTRASLDWQNPDMLLSVSPIESAKVSALFMVERSCPETTKVFKKDADRLLTQSLFTTRKERVPKTGPVSVTT